MSDKCWDYLKKSNYDFVGVCETHAIESQFTKWDVKARGVGYHLLAHRARPKRKGVARAMIHRSCEGGEWFLARQHLQVQISFTKSTATMLKAPRQAALDCFQTVIAHMRGYSIALVVFYGLPSVQFSGGNVT
eukprot:4169665-Pyramimonas_sp.AAC.1